MKISKIRRGKWKWVILLILPLLLPLERLRRQSLIVGKWRTNGDVSRFMPSGKYQFWTANQPIFYGSYKVVGLFQLNVRTSYYNYGGVKKSVSAIVSLDELSNTMNYKDERDDVVSAQRFWLNWNGTKMWLKSNESKNKGYTMLEKYGDAQDE